MKLLFDQHLSPKSIAGEQGFMSHTTIWKQFGEALSSHHARTLAAYLGHRNSQQALRTDSIPFPTIEHFRTDSAFDPNPHQLNIPEDLLETSLFVQSLALWGPDVLIRSALACAATQIKHHAACPADLVIPRDAAFDAVKKFVESPTDENGFSVRQASKRCADFYSPYEEEPDSPEAIVVWFHLGAPWFAAETAAQDHKLEEYDGPGPREASPTWCTRNAVWLTRAADAAAKWSSHDNVRETIRGALIDWLVTHD